MLPIHNLPGPLCNRLGQGTGPPLHGNLPEHMLQPGNSPQAQEQSALVHSAHNQLLPAWNLPQRGLDRHWPCSQAGTWVTRQPVEKWVLVAVNPSPETFGGLCGGTTTNHNHSLTVLVLGGDHRNGSEDPAQGVQPCSCTDNIC